MILKSCKYNILIVYGESGEEPQLELIHQMNADLMGMPVILVGLIEDAYAAFRSSALACGSIVREVKTDKIEELVQVIDDLDRLSTLESEISRLNSQMNRLTSLLESANTRVLEQRQRILHQERLRTALEQSGATIARLNQPLSVLLGSVELLQARGEQHAECCTPLSSQIATSAEEINLTIGRIQNLHHLRLKAHLNDDYLFDLDADTHRLLVAVADADHRRSLEKCLGQIRQRFLTEWQATSDEVLASVKEQSFDIALIDTSLTGGVPISALLREIDQLCRRPMVILLSAEEDEPLVRKALQGSAADYLPWSLLSTDLLAQSIHQTLCLSIIEDGLASIEERLGSSAALDPLTGLSNPPRFHTILTEEFERAKRHQRPLTVAVFEIDGWNDIMEALGTEGGEEILQVLGKAIADQARRADCIAHLSPGRFAAVLPETTKEGVYPIAVRLSKLLLECGPVELWKDVPNGLTLSAGLSDVDDVPPARNGQELFLRASDAHARAWAAGGGSVVSWDAPASQITTTVQGREA